MIENRTKAIIVTLLILISISFNNVLTKVTLRSVTPAALIYLSTLVGIITMSVYTFIIEKERIPKKLFNRQVWSYILQIAFFNFVLGTLSTISLNYLPVTTNAYLSNFIGFVTMAMSIIFLKEIPGIWQLIGALIAFSGLLIFFPAPPERAALLGIGMILVAITGVAYTNNIARKLALITMNKISNNLISTLAIAIGGSFASLIYILIDGFPPLVPTWKEWGMIIFSGVVAKAIGLTVWNLILRTLRSYEASILGASTVIWSSLFSVAILNEKISINQVIAIGMMLVGLTLVQIRGIFPVMKFRKKPNIYGKNED